MMGKTFKKSSQFSTLLTVLLVATPAFAEPIHPYAEPIALGDEAVDIGEVLAAAFQPTPWTLVKESDALYVGELSYRGFDVRAEISVVDNVLTLTLDSITETGCGSNCKNVDVKRASNWLVSLRRSITYELTIRVRDSLQLPG